MAYMALLNASPQTPFCMPNHPIMFTAKIVLTINLAPDLPKPASQAVQDAAPKSQPIIPVITIPITTTRYPRDPEIIAGHIGIASASKAPSRKAGTQTQIPACTNARETQSFRSSSPIGFNAMASTCFCSFFIILRAFTLPF